MDRIRARASTLRPLRDAQFQIGNAPLLSLGKRQEMPQLRGRLTGMREVPYIAARTRTASTWLMLGCLLLPMAAHAAERVTLQSGFDLLCDHRVADGATTRLFLDRSSANYIDVATAAIVSEGPVESIGKVTEKGLLKPELPGSDQTGSPLARVGSVSTGEVLTPSELHEVLRGAGAAHDLDVDLLASVVHAESGSRVHARSRAGAQGLMQLMPGTAAELGVHDSYSPKENVGGGAAYLDTLLTRYRGNITWALAAYNAGPGAVDRWHGVPPYRETRAYVARIVHEFNQRYMARLAAAQSGPTVAQKIDGGLPLPNRTAQGERRR